MGFAGASPESGILNGEPAALAAGFSKLNTILREKPGLMPPARQYCVETDMKADVLKKHHYWLVLGASLLLASPATGIPSADFSNVAKSALWTQAAPGALRVSIGAACMRSRCRLFPSIHNCSLAYLAIPFLSPLCA